MVVQEKAEPQHPARPQVGLVWQYETHRPGQVRRLGQQDFTFLQGLAYQAELVGFEVAQAAMDQLARLG